MGKKLRTYYLVIKLYRQNIYTSREIAVALKLKHETVKKWIQIDYANRLLNNKSTKDIEVRTTRQPGFTSWVDSILHKEIKERRSRFKKKEVKIEKVS